MKLNTYCTTYRWKDVRVMEPDGLELPVKTLLDADAIDLRALFSAVEGELERQGSAATPEQAHGLTPKSFAWKHPEHGGTVETTGLIVGESRKTMAVFLARFLDSAASAHLLTEALPDAGTEEIDSGENLDVYEALVEHASDTGYLDQLSPAIVLTGDDPKQQKFDSRKTVLFSKGKEEYLVLRQRMVDQWNPSWETLQDQNHSMRQSSYRSLYVVDEPIFSREDEEGPEPRTWNFVLELNDELYWKYGKEQGVQSDADAVPHRLIEDLNRRGRQVPVPDRFQFPLATKFTTGGRIVGGDTEKIREHMNSDNGPETSMKTTFRKKFGNVRIEPDELLSRSWYVFDVRQPSVNYANRVVRDPEVVAELLSGTSGFVYVPERSGLSYEFMEPVPEEVWFSLRG